MSQFVEQRNNRLTLYVTDELKKLIKENAAREHKTVSKYLKDILEQKVMVSYYEAT